MRAVRLLYGCANYVQVRRMDFADSAACGEVSSIASPQLSLQEASYPCGFRILGLRL